MPARADVFSLYGIPASPGASESVVLLRFLILLR